ncbi:FHA protein, partial [Geosmithia morbida]
DTQTPATQNVLDPRRLGKQNSGFSDEDISDIICVLYPHSAAARQEVSRLAAEASPFIIGQDEAGGAEYSTGYEDDLGGQDGGGSLSPPPPAVAPSYAVILRLSSTLKSPAVGCAFGRNPSRCDIVFTGDPYKRVSNVHFRIYVNEYGNVMIEDQSTNGTHVDNHVLHGRPAPGQQQLQQQRQQPGGQQQQAHGNRRVLSSGSVIKIYLHRQTQDLTFRVRIPRRDEEYEQAYANKVVQYFARHGLATENGVAPPEDNGGANLAPAHTGPVDIFKTPGRAAQRQQRTAGGGGGGGGGGTNSPRRKWDAVAAAAVHRSKEWTGSGKYNKVRSIGKGAFAVVYKVTGKFDGKPYAAKELEKRHFIRNGVLDQKVENEMKIMERVQHPNIVRYIENFEWDDRLLIIIMEYISGGDLGHLVGANGPLPEDVTQSMARQLLSALEYLHQKNITHRDVKPDNILVKSVEPIEVKLTDFGLSKMVDSEQTFLRTFCGTLLYCAPEVYTEYVEYDDNGYRNRGQKMRRVPGQRYSHAIDIWSLAGVLYFCLTKSPPYPVSSGISYSELLHKIMTTKLDVRPLLAAGVSDAGVDFLSRMLQRKPENRATIADLDSHAWFRGQGSIIEASQSYDDMTDDDDLAAYVQSQHEQQVGGKWDAQLEHDEEEDRILDSMGEEDDDDGDGAQQRLFGEVGSSAVGSSGAVHDNFLNLPVSLREDSSLYEGTPAGTRTYRPVEDDDNGGADAGQRRQSDDQLQSLVENVASQSLGGNGGGGDDGSEAQAQAPAQAQTPAPAPAATPGPASSCYSISDVTASKRKPPPSADTSDEHVPHGHPVLKRLKSDIYMDDMAEAKLLACVPAVKRSESGRQIDEPVDKVVYWQQDKSTWHLDYPEMTQLQTTAFQQAAKMRGETFEPGRTPLWDLAMRYFPSTTAATTTTITAATTRTSTMTSPPTSSQAGDGIPSTAVLADHVHTPVPNPSPQEQQQIVVPVHSGASPARAVGLIQSHARSCIKDISFSITEPLVSFGRHPDNTQVFRASRERRVPKFAFDIAVWREGDEALPRAPYPWSSSTAKASEYSFWISTKATVGIHVNGHELPSREATTPSGLSRNWARLHDGDVLVIWGKPNGLEQTTLTFQCLWGGASSSSSSSSSSRGLSPEASASAAGSGQAQGLDMASPEASRKLDDACRRAERRAREAAEIRRRREDASNDLVRRKLSVHRERERSDAFEVQRAEAVSILAQQAQKHRSARAASAGIVTASSTKDGSHASLLNTSRIYT